MLYRLAAIHRSCEAQETRQPQRLNRFVLDDNPPTVCVEACYSKHRRTDVSASRREDLVRRLRDYLVRS